MIALVTGATGCIGYALAERLTASGEYSEVRALVRLGREAALPPGVRPITGTLDNLTALQTAAKNVDVVFHCAAKVHDANGNADEFFRVNRDGTQNLLDACSSQNHIPPRFVFFSTVAVFGDDTPPEGLPKDVFLNPQTPYAASKVEGAARVAKWASKNHAPALYHILHVATVYGPRDRGNLGRMMKAIAENRFVIMGDGTNRKTCANVQNVVTAAIAVSKEEAPIHGLVVADPAPYTLQELHDAMREALIKTGWKPSPPRLPRSLPVPVALALSHGVTGAAKLLRRNSPLTPAQVRRIAANNVYQTDRLSAVAGYFPTGTLSQGMDEMARWLFAEKQIKGQAQ